ncbi:MAG: flavin reductase, partial [Oscillospiraceae bacterium]|nr:flavin reductase [Oscillospiraceae bacterium]
PPLRRSGGRAPLPAPSWASPGSGWLGGVGVGRALPPPPPPPHYTNQGIKSSRTLSINIVDEAMLPKADYAGCVSGSQEDKSGLFPYQVAEGGAPIINEAPVSMVCTVDDIYETEGFESFICKIVATYAEESVLTAEGKIDYRTLKPVLFEFPTYEYLKTGDVIGKCRSFGKQGG